MVDINKILEFDKRFDYFVTEIAKITEVYTKMTDEMVIIEQLITAEVINQMADPNFKKLALEKQEKAACVGNPELTSEYLKLVGYRQKEKSLRKILDGLDKAGSLTQSQSKNSVQTDYTPNTGYGAVKK